MGKVTFQRLFFYLIIKYAKRVELLFLPRNRYNIDFHYDIISKHHTHKYYVHERVTCKVTDFNQNIIYRVVVFELQETIQPDV